MVRLWETATTPGRIHFRRRILRPSTRRLEELTTSSDRSTAFLYAAICRRTRYRAWSNFLGSRPQLPLLTTQKALPEEIHGLLPPTSLTTFDTAISGRGTATAELARVIMS